jgi:hypothetical protein
MKKLILIGVALTSVALAGCVYRPYGSRYYDGGYYGDRYSRSYRDDGYTGRDYRYRNPDGRYYRRGDYDRDDYR